MDKLTEERLDKALRRTAAILMDAISINREIVHSRNEYGIPDISDLQDIDLEILKTHLKNWVLTGECDHSLVYDIPGCPYDIRNCAVCEKCMGGV
jgi:hypothetical protein